MSTNILITGAAGYIGGSLLADFVLRTSGPIKEATISAAVRSKEQVQALSKLGVNVIQLDLADKVAVLQAVLGNEIDMVISAAPGFDTGIVGPMIEALGERRKVSGKETYYIQSSVTPVYSKHSGWTHGEISDTDAVYEKEKQSQDAAPHPVRETNIFVVEQAKAHSVTSFIIPVATIYGRGTGEWRKLSVALPQYIRTSIEHKIVYQFDEDGISTTAHISDLVDLYGLLVEKILRSRGDGGEPAPPSGEQGYYFASAHGASWWEVMRRLADGLYARGLVTEPQPRNWPSDEMAAEYLGWPIRGVRAMGISTPEVVPVNAYRLGWKPKWDEKRYLESLDDEIAAVQELDTVKPTIFNALMDSSKWKSA